MILKFQDKDGYGKAYYNVCNKVERLRSSIEELDETLDEEESDSVEPIFVDAHNGAGGQAVKEIDVVCFSTECGRFHKVFLPSSDNVTIYDDKGNKIDLV